MIDAAITPAAYRAARIVATGLVAAVVLVMFVRHPGMTGYYRETFPDVVYGRAYKPYVFRALVPFAIRTIAKTVPRARRLELSHDLGANPSVEFLIRNWRLNWEPDFLFEYSIAVVVLFGLLLGYIAAVEYLARGVYEAPPGFAEVAALVAVLGLPPMFRWYSQVYDFATLCLFTLALGLMVRQRWIAYGVAYVLACVNKETTILLALIFFVHYFNNPRVSRQLFLKLLAFQLVAAATVLVALHLYYRGNPGGVVESHLLDNVLLIRPYGVADVMAGLALALLIFNGWSEKPPFLAHAALALGPLVVLTLFFGMIVEYRDYYEAYSALFLLAAPSVAKLVGVPVIARGETAPEVAAPLRTLGKASGWR